MSAPILLPTTARFEPLMRWQSCRPYDVREYSCALARRPDQHLPDAPYRGVSASGDHVRGERLMDKAAVASALIRFEIRRRNLVRPFPINR